MKKNLSIMAVAAITLTLGACSNEKENNEPQAAPKYITVSTQISGRTTIANDGTQVFANGDKISVYAWTGTATEIPSSLVVNNSINSYDGTKWTATPQMLWKDMTSAHYFLSVYPQKAITDFKSDAYTLDVANQEGSDLLVATNVTGQTATNAPVPLQFDHIMAKLVINLTFRNQWGGTPTVTSVVAQAVKTATVNYLTKAVTPGSDIANILMPVTADNTKYSSVMVPQSTTFNTIIIEINGTSYSYYDGKGISLQSGKITTVNLIVGRDTITLGDVSINNWTEGSTINGGEAHESLIG